MSVAGTVAAQAKWDDAFGYLSVPYNYDSSLVYASIAAANPLVWGGYIARRGKAFLKGRPTIAGYDATTRNAKVYIILAK